MEQKGGGGGGQGGIKILPPRMSEPQSQHQRSFRKSNWALRFLQGFGFSWCLGFAANP